MKLRRWDYRYGYANVTSARVSLGYISLMLRDGVWLVLACLFFAVVETLRGPLSADKPQFAKSPFATQT
jgi:hypothetical protein